MKAAAEDRAMMGERRVAQDSLFYEFSLEGHVLLPAICCGRSTGSSI
jgi:hypothetical protein